MPDEKRISITQTEQWMMDEDRVILGLIGVRPMPRERADRMIAAILKMAEKLERLQEPKQAESRI